MSRVKWYGCEVDPAPAGATCDTIETPKSDDRKKYRHFAVDTTTASYLLDYPQFVTIGATATLAGVTTERSTVKRRHHKEKPANQEWSPQPNANVSWKIQ